MTTTQQHWTHWLGRFKPGARVRRGARRAPDFADYGTAFGLDLSLSATAGVGPASPGSAATAAPAVTGQPGREALPGEPATSKPAR